MFSHRISESAGTKTYVDWALLAFLAGSVNTGGYLACHRFVTHVTGFATLAGVSAAHGAWQGAIGILTVPLYFLLGVMVSAYLIDRRIHEGKNPKFALVMFTVSGLLLLAGLGGYWGWFGTFGIDLELKHDYIFLSLLCAASGLQNAALTTATGATIRTTHLTGVTTDLGIGLVRASALSVQDPRRALEVKASYLRAGTVLAFMTGSGIGALLFLQIGYLGFVLPATIAFYAATVALFERKPSDLSS